MAIQFMGYEITPSLTDALRDCFLHLSSLADPNPLYVAIDVAAARGLGPLSNTDGALALATLQQQLHSSTVRPNHIGGESLPSYTPWGIVLNAEMRYCPTELNFADNICWPLIPAGHSTGESCNKSGNGTIGEPEYIGIQYVGSSELNVHIISFCHVVSDSVL